jgi:iron complex outermembrane receptor protein
VSDNLGRFELRADPGDSLRVSHVAFEPGLSILGPAGSGEDLLRVTLQPRLLSLKTLVVLGGASEAGARFGQVRSRANSTEEALALVENLSLVRRGAYAHDPQIRGLSAARLDLRVDGMVVHGACTDRMDPVTSYLDLDAIAEAEITAGAGDARSGTAGGGSIRLAHRGASFRDAPGMEARLALSGADALDQGGLSLRLERSAPRLGLLVYGSFEEAGDYRSPAGTEPLSGHRKANAYGSLRLQTRHQGDWHLLLQSDDSWDVGYAALPMDVGYARYRALSLENNRSLGTRVPGRLTTQVYHNRVDHWMDDSTRELLLMGMHMDMPGFTRTSGLRLEHLAFPGPDTQTRFGVEGHLVNQFADMLMRPEASATMYLLTWPDVRTATAATWLGVQRSLGRLRLELDGRLELRRMQARSEQGLSQIRLSLPEAPAARNDLPLSLGIGLDWRLASFLETGLGISAFRRAPSTTEAYAYYLYVANDGFLYSGDPTLELERGIQLEGRLALRTEQAEARLTVYHYELADVIRGLVDDSEVPVPFARGWKRYGNGGRARLNGLEARGSLGPFGPWRLEASGALQRARFLDTADPPAGPAAAQRPDQPGLQAPGFHPAAGPAGGGGPQTPQPRSRRDPFARLRPAGSPPGSPAEPGPAPGPGSGQPAGPRLPPGGRLGVGPASGPHDLGSPGVDPGRGFLTGQADLNAKRRLDPNRAGVSRPLRPVRNRSAWRRGPVVEEE